MVDGRITYLIGRTVLQSSVTGSDDMDISQATTIKSESSEDASNDTSVTAFIATTPLDFINSNVTYPLIGTDDPGTAVTCRLVGTLRTQMSYVRALYADEHRTAVHGRSVAELQTAVLQLNIENKCDLIRIQLSNKPAIPRARNVFETNKVCADCSLTPPVR
jgi:hypothetical protein